MDGITAEDAAETGLAGAAGDGGIAVHEQNASGEGVAAERAQIEQGTGLAAHGAHHRGPRIQGRAAGDDLNTGIADEVDAAAIEHQIAGDQVAAARAVVQVEGGAALDAG